MTVSPIKPCLCWHCGFHQNTMQHLPNQPVRPPREGDLSLCAKCGAIARFAAETWREPTQAEIAALPDGVRRKLAVALIMQRQGLGKLDQPVGHA